MKRLSQFLNWKSVLIGAVLAVMVISALVITTLNRTSRPTTEITPTPEETLTASPAVSPSLSPEDQEFSKATPEEINRQDPQDRNPILVYLPHHTSYWTLDLKGGREGAYVLVAKVIVGPGENAEEKFRQQRPYVEAFVGSTGQTPGTYTIEYVPRSPEDEDSA